MEKGWINTYNWVVKLLQDLDFADAAQHRGLILVSGNELHVNFTGLVYAITKDGIVLKNEILPRVPLKEETEYNLRSVLGYYALSDAAGTPAGEYCLFETFSKGVFNSGGLSYMTSPLRRAIGDDYAKFESLAGKLSMRYEGRQGSGYKWHYDLLPTVPVKLIFYEGDDEFPSEVKVLYDKSAILIFNFETLAVLHSCFTRCMAGIVLQEPL